MTPTLKLESRIAEFFGRSYCLLTGSGTASLYLIFRSLGLSSNSNILFPNITCETAVNAAVFAGLNPVFCDIDKNSYHPSVEQVCLAVHKYKPKVFVGTHIFGLPYTFPLQEQLNNNPPIFIEDAAQGYGFGHTISNIGQLGLASIMSFGAGKTLDCNRGGAILTDDLSFLHECQNIQSEMILAPETSSSLMQEVFSIRKEFPLRSGDYINQYKKALYRHKLSFISRFPLEVLQELSNKFDSILKISRQRAEQATQTSRIVSERFGSQILSLPTQCEDSVLWKLPFLVESKERGNIAKILSQDGFNITRFFKPLSQSFEASDENYQNSIDFYKKIINIAVSK